MSLVDIDKRFLSEELTDMEKVIVSYLLNGEGNKEISYCLGQELTTIKYHMRNICYKLNAKNRTHAALIIQKLLH